MVDYLRRVNRVKRISLVGWSAGGPRVGGYVSQHPDKAERVVLFAPSEPNPKLKDIPADPGSGAPTKIQSRQDLEQVKTPMLIVTGTLDRPAARQRAYDHLTVRDKAFVLVESASHFMNWEKQRHVLHAASLEWLGHSRINGRRGGSFAVDWNGHYSAITIKD